MGLEVLGSGFKGSKVLGSGFKGSGFRGSKIHGFRVQSFMVQRFSFADGLTKFLLIDLFGFTLSGYIALNT
jgi:hypothetical protein